MDTQNKCVDSLINKKWEYEPIKPSKELECCICMDIFIDPVLHTLCGNMFCRECIMKVSKCPICRKEIKESDLVPAPNYVKNQLAQVKVKCKQCNQEMTREASATHKESCEFDCPFGCGCKITINTIKEHAPKNCSKCANKCCYSEFGCPWCGPGGS